MRLRLSTVKISLESVNILWIYFDHKVDWDDVKILNSSLRAYRRRVTETFLINQTARLPNLTNCNDGANFPAVYSVFIVNK